MRLSIQRLALTALLVAALLQGRALAQYTPVVGYQSQDYTGPSVTSHALQRFSLFVPNCPPPASGYPAILSVNNSGLASSGLATEIKSSAGIPYQALESGFAVISVSATFSKAGQPYAGNGLFHPPGRVPPGWVGPPPYGDLTRPMAEKDVVMIVQHVRHNAVALGIDPTRIVLHGRSGGAIVSMWCALGPERAAMTFPAGTGQETESTRVAATILQSGAVYFPAFKQSQISGAHWPAVGGAPLFQTPASKLQGTFYDWQLEASALHYEDPVLNAQMPVYMTYGQATASTQYTPTTPGQKDYVQNALTDHHSSWSGFVWKTLYPSQTRLVLTSTKPEPFSGGLHDALIEDDGVLGHDVCDWLEGTLSISSSWQNLGNGLAAPGSPTPYLRGCGSLASGTIGQLGLSGTAPNSFVLLVFGTSRIDLPTLSGQLVPAPDLVMSFQTDGKGALQHPIHFNQLPSGFSSWFQYWVFDPAGPMGFTASNAVLATKP